MSRLLLAVPRPADAASRPEAIAARACLRRACGRSWHQAEQGSKGGERRAAVGLRAAVLAFEAKRGRGVGGQRVED